MALLDMVHTRLLSDGGQLSTCKPGKPSLSCPDTMIRKFRFRWSLQADTILDSGTFGRQLCRLRTLHRPPCSLWPTLPPTTAPACDAGR